jgi:hypothetical protein
MKFFSAAAAVLAFAAQALAQTADFDPIYTPSNGEVVPAGKTYKITWSAPAKYSAETISIHLIGGASQNTQVPLQDIAAGVANSANAFEWTVGATLGADNVYGLVFKLESNPEIFQYSMPFKISKADGVVSSSAAGSATTTLTATGGVKTVTLSSSAITSTSVIVKSTSVVVKPTSAPVAHNTTVPCDTKTVVTIHSAYTNCTTLSTAPVVVVPTTHKGVPAPSGTSVTPPPAQVTSAAGRLGAGIFAAMVIAAFAL